MLLTLGPKPTFSPTVRQGPSSGTRSWWKREPAEAMLPACAAAAACRPASRATAGSPTFARSAFRRLRNSASTDDGATGASLAGRLTDWVGAAGAGEGAVVVGGVDA